MHLQPLFLPVHHGMLCWETRPAVSAEAALLTAVNPACWRHSGTLGQAAFLGAVLPAPLLLLWCRRKGSLIPTGTSEQAGLEREHFDRGGYAV
jgi:hypothetical protein